ncbi:MAG: UDP-glucose 4-epimerase, partial [uncultured Blastococcus sp.]
AEGARLRLRRFHRWLRRRGAAAPRLLGDRDRRPLEVRPGGQVLRRPPRLPARRRRCPGHRAAHRPPSGVRPLRRGGRAHRRHLLLPRLRLRPARRQRADHGLLLRRLAGRAPRRPAAEGDLHQLLDGVRVGRGMAVGRGLRAADPPATVVLRLPEARRRVLRPGCLGPVPAPVHDRASLQLRRCRRGPCTGRRRGEQRQREAGDEPRRSRPRPEGVEGAGPPARPRRRHAGPALHLRRRPGAGHRDGDGTPRGPQRGLQPLHRPGDVGHRARRGHLAQGEGGRGTPDACLRPGVRARRPAPRAVDGEGRAGSRVQGDDHDGRHARRGDPLDREGTRRGHHL